MNLKNSKNKKFDYDVIIVGCGPAGSITARYLHPDKNDLKVLIIDRKKKIGLPVQCGEGILGSINEQEIGKSTYDKNELFECPKNAKAHRIKLVQVIFYSTDKKIDIPVKGYTLNRDIFDQYLAKRAIEEGAILKKATSVLRVKDENTLITSQGEVSGNIIVGADGPLSLIAKSFGFKITRSLARCVNGRLRGDFNDNTMKIFFGPQFKKGYAWIFSKGDHANIGYGTESIYKPKNKSNSFAKKLDCFIKQQLQIKKIDFISRGGGLIPAGGMIPKIVKNNILIVGDAAGMVNPLSGAGIDSAMIAGRECGTAIVKYLKFGEDLNNYEKKCLHFFEKSYRKGFMVKKLFQLMTNYKISTEILFQFLNKVEFVKFSM